MNSISTSFRSSLKIFAEKITPVSYALTEIMQSKFSYFLFFDFLDFMTFFFKLKKFQIMLIYLILSKVKVFLSREIERIKSFNDKFFKS